MLTLPLFFAILFIGPLLVELFGRGFVQAWTIIEILSIANLINITAGPVGFMLIMTGRPGVELLNVITVGVGNIVLNAWLIPHFGGVGAAMGTGLSMVTINLLRLAEVHKLLHCHPFSIQTLKTFSAFGLSYAATFSLNRFFQFEGWWSVTLMVPFLLSYGGLLTMLGWDDEDRYVLRILRNKLYVPYGVKNQPSIRTDAQL